MTEDLERALAAATRRNAELNAFVTIDIDGARAAAPPQGPLAGALVAVKDVIDTAGLRTTMGSRHFADHVPDHDAAAVRAVRDAGGIVIGKTTTHEYAYGPTGDRSANGPARNPHDPSRMSGGSSAGSAVAVAAGITRYALGTDTGGSVRIPAACCGIVGLRPTLGSLPADGVFSVAPTLDTVGPMARTVRECRLLWHVLAGTSPAATPDTYRIAWVHPDSGAPVDDAVRQIAHDAFRTLRGRSDVVGEIDVPEMAELRRLYPILQGREISTVHSRRLEDEPELYGDEVLTRLRAAQRVTEADYESALESRRTTTASVRTLFDDWDVLALPTVPIVAPEIDVRTVHIEGATVDVRDALLSYTSPWSVSGFPALSVPAGTVDGLPVGLQLVGKPGSDDLLFTLAERLTATDELGGP